MIARGPTRTITHCTYQLADRQPKGIARRMNSLHRVCLARQTILNNNPMNFKPVLEFPEQKKNLGEVI